MTSPSSKTMKLPKYFDKELPAENLTLNEISWKIMDKYFKEYPNHLVEHHLKSFNNFIQSGIYNIFKENGKIIYETLNTSDNENEIKNKMTLYLGGRDGKKIYFGKPVIYDTSHPHYMYPNDARLRNMNYSTTIYYDVDVVFEYNLNTFNEKGEKERKIETTTLEKILLGKFPIMTQSSLCILQNIDRTIRYNMGECRNDYGGYFIIDGKEKVIVSQEDRAYNMIYVEKNKADDLYSHYVAVRSKSEDTSKPIRKTEIKIVAPSGTYSNNNIVVFIPNVRQPIPLFIVMRALGILSDERIIKMCLYDLNKNKYMMNLFIPSIQDAGNIYTQELAIKFIASFTKRRTIADTKEILSDYFLPHVGELNFINKAYYIGYMTYRLLKVFIGESLPTDRDNFQYKRIELTGDLLTALFREYFLLYRTNIYQAIQQKEYYHRSEYENNFTGLVLNNVDNIFIVKSPDNKKTIRIVEDGLRKAFKGNWGSKTYTKRQGIVQDLARLSWNTFASHLRKINLPIDSTAKVVGPRLLNPSQMGYIDPIDTPDGANIGLHKHLALGCQITSGFSSQPLIQWLFSNIPFKNLYECDPLLISNTSKLFVNGNWIGVIQNTLQIEFFLKLCRRNGIIPIQTSISFNFDLNELHIYTDSGRMMRPIYYIFRNIDIVNLTSTAASIATNTTMDETLQISTTSYNRPMVLHEIQNGTIDWQKLTTGFKQKPDGFNINNNVVYNIEQIYPDLKDAPLNTIYKELIKYAGVIDLIDCAESSSALIAMYETDLKKTPNYYTHIEIEHSLMLGVMGNQIIFPDNNPLTRNSFSCGQSKQAVSLYHSNYDVRMDKMGVVLNNGQIPLVKSKLLEYINHEEQPYGVNVMVAIMCYNGYNVEDAILINEGAIKRGLFLTTYFTTYESHEESSQVSGNSTSKFANIEQYNVIKKKEGYDYSHLDANGMIKQNTVLNDKIVLIGKILPNPDNNDTWIDASEFPKKGQVGYVDKAFITEGEEGFNIAKVRIYEQRTPAIGDKFASRSGQKGTIGLVVPECDMPVNSQGIAPDIIINPHAIPSRMTVGQIIEMLLGKICLYYGGFGDCTAFQTKGINYHTYAPIMAHAGFNYTGNELLYNGFNGEQITTDIYVGPTYYMRLKHMVKDKINYRALGPRSQLTRQTIGGRANDGGLRIGEMERDGILAHGMTMVLNDSFLTRGDEYYMAVCNQSGAIAIYNKTKKLFISPYLDGPLKFTTTYNVSALDNQNNTINNDLKVIDTSNFGKDFSIIRIPYAFKLLLQELQVLNIQVKIITDKNIHQLYNSVYSYNIDGLLNIGLSSDDISMPSTNLLPPDVFHKTVKTQIDKCLAEIHRIYNSTPAPTGTATPYDKTIPIRTPPTYTPTSEINATTLDNDHMVSDNDLANIVPDNALDNALDNVPDTDTDNNIPNTNSANINQDESALPQTNNDKQNTANMPTIKVNPDIVIKGPIETTTPLNNGNTASATTLATMSQEQPPVDNIPDILKVTPTPSLQPIDEPQLQDTTSQLPDNTLTPENNGSTKVVKILSP